MRNLKVTAHLAAPLAGDAPQLDALLIYKQSLHHNCDRAWPAPRQEKGCIPLAREWLGDWYVFRSSSPVVGPCSESVDHYTRRTPVEHASLLAANKRTVVATGNSWTKSYRLPLRIRNVDRVVWFVVGEGSPLRKILKRTASIGKKTSFGYGLVSRWTVEEVEHDWSWFADAVLMRPLPLASLPDGIIGWRRDFGACVPPYWHPERYTEIVTPC